MKTIIIGAGITGLSCAYHLNNRTDYLVFERENTAGGLCRSITQDNFTFDYTGHAIHVRNEYAKQLVNKLLKGNINTVNRNARIYSNNIFVQYPFQANLYGLPENVVRDCLTGLVDSYLKYGKGKVDTGLSFREWVLRVFGRGFGKHFFYPYNTKLWSVHPDKMTAKWAGDFVPRPKMEEVIIGAIEPQNKKFGYNINFYYPGQGGIQSLINELFKSVNNINFNTEVMRVDPAKKTVYTDSGEHNYEKLVSTMPLPELLDKIQRLPAGINDAGKKLAYASVLCINLGIKPKKLNKNHKFSWVYFPEKQFPFYRVGFYNNFSGKSVPPGCISLYIELSYPGKPGNNIPELTTGLYNRVLSGLRECGIISKGDEIITRNVLPIKYAYVVYDGYREQALNKILAYLNKNNIYSIGRYGAWKYSYIEESILDGKAVAEKLCRK